MGVVSVTEAKQTASMVADRSGHRYTAPYLVEVSDARVGSFAIVDYFGDVLGRGIDSYFRYGDDYDMFSFCDSIRPTRRQRSLTQWDVVLEYSTPTDDGQRDQQEWRDPDGAPTRDPFSWKGSLSIATQYVEVPVWKAWNVDAFPLDSTTGTYHRPANTLGPVVNSAGVVLDPPLTVSYPERVIQCSFNVPDWDEEDARVNENHINQMPIRFAPGLLSGFNVHQRTFDRYTLKCTTVQGQYGEVTGPAGNRISYWKVSMEFRVRLRSPAGDPFDGWLETVLDRGLTRGAEVGDPDGFGGQYSSDDLESGMGRATPIHGPSGGRIGELVLLDGTGQPLTDLDGTDAQNGVYCRWRVNPLATFLLLPYTVFEGA